MLRLLGPEVMAVSGTGTKEYQAIKHHYATLIDTLGKTVNPTHFAGRLGEKSLIPDGKSSRVLLAFQGWG